MEHIYIASSWKNRHAVEMLTALLRNKGYKVNCFIEQEAQFEGLAREVKVDFDEWVKTKDADKCFIYDISSAKTAKLVIYIGPSGSDAWAEVGCAFSCSVPVIGLYSKGEQSGLMRLMMDQWFYDYETLLDAVEIYMSRDKSA